MSRRRVDGVKVHFRAAAGPFAPLLRPSYESLEAEASTIPAIEPRYQTTFLGPDARVVCTSCCCKKAAADTADCHRKGDGVAPRAAAPSYSSRLLAAALIVARGSPYFGRCALRTALTASVVSRGIRAPRHAIEETSVHSQHRVDSAGRTYGLLRDAGP